MKERKCSICEEWKPLKYFVGSSFKCTPCLKKTYDGMTIDYKTDILCLDGEEWMPIKRYEEFHEISNFGRLSALYKSKGQSFEKLNQRKILCPPINIYSGYLSHVFAQWGPRELSRLMGMTYSTIAHIKNGSRWTHITGGKK